MSAKIKDLAKKLNVSITTVSRALDGYLDVSEATRERVRLAAEEVGYIPNQAARQLRTQRTDTIGFILPAEAKRIDEPFFVDLIAGMGDALSDRNFDLLVANAKSISQEEAIYSRWIRSRKVDGFILNRLTVDDWRVKILSEKKIPFAAIGRPQNGAVFPYVYINGGQQYSATIASLAAKGFSRFGFIGGPPNLLNQVERFAWFTSGLSQIGLAHNPHWVVSTEMTSTGGYEAALQLLSLAERPDMICCINDEVAFGVLHAAHQVGLKIGTQLAVLGFDGVKDARHTNPPLSTLDIPLYEIGNHLVQMLLSHLKDQAQENMWEVQPEVCLRASTGD